MVHLVSVGFPLVGFHVSVGQSAIKSGGWGLQDLQRTPTVISVARPLQLIANLVRGSALRGLRQAAPSWTDGGQVTPEEDLSTRTTL